MVRNNITPVNYSPGRVIYVNGVRTPVTISGITLHTEQGYENGTVAWFKNPLSAVSSNYGVALDGTIDRIVDEGNTAWTDGNFESNSRHITIECEDNNDPQNIVRPDAQYESIAKLVADAARRYDFPINRDHIKGHNEIPPHTHPECPGDLDINRVVTRAQEIAGILNTPITQPSPDVLKEYYDWIGQVKVIIAVLNVRTAPTTGASGSQANTSDGMLHGGMLADVVGWGVGEDPYQDGRNKWYKSYRGKWFWAGGTDQPNPVYGQTQVPVQAPVVIPVSTPPGPEPAPMPAQIPTAAPDPTPAVNPFKTTLFATPQKVLAHNGGEVIDMATGKAVAKVQPGRELTALGYVFKDNVYYLHTANMENKNLGLPSTEWTVLPLNQIQDIKPPTPDAPAKPTLDETLIKTNSRLVRWLLKAFHLVK